MVVVSKSFVFNAFERKRFCGKKCKFVHKINNCLTAWNGKNASISVFKLCHFKAARKLIGARAPPINLFKLKYALIHSIAIFSQFWVSD